MMRGHRQRTRTRPRAKAAIAVVAALAVGATGCGADDGPDDAQAPDTGTDAPADPPADEPGDGGEGAAAPGQGSVEVAGPVVEELDSPWGLVKLPDGDLLVGSRDEATILRVDTAEGTAEEVASVPDVAADGEGGLLGLALSPDEEWLYAYHTAPGDNRIIRMPLEDGTPGEPEVVFDGIPRDATIHHGGGLAFGPDDMLYAATGDANEPDLAQDPDSLAGKILRLTPEGEPAPDNPEEDSPVWSSGHRNVQGMAWDDEGRMWATEFGASDVDELNLIEAGENYGWPMFEGSGGADEGYVDPEVEWPVAEASPSGLAFHNGALWMAALRGERLWRIPLDATGTVGEPEAFLQGEYGRLRNVLAVPDTEDELLLVTNETDTRGTPEAGDDRILRLRVE
ncbi:PQQ-dependent sugar dehydrogenase [Streptomyces calidiresistens]